MTLYLAMRRAWDETGYPEVHLCRDLEEAVDWTTDIMYFEDQRDVVQEEVRRDLRSLVNTEIFEGVYGLIRQMEVPE